MKLSRLIGMIPFEAERALSSKVNALLGRRPSSTPFLSGDTYRAMADALYDETSSCGPGDVAPGAIVFVSIGRLREFAAKVLPELNAPFVLVTHQGDANIDESYRDIADHPMVAHWFAQNCLFEHHKLTPLPIGLEDRWRHNNGALGDFKRSGRKGPPTLPRIAYAFTIGTNVERRVECYMALKRCAAADELSLFMNASLYRKTVRSYMLIASPPGNGVDCHRTWEAMYMRCSPLVEDSAMTRRFKESGLPLTIVADWKEAASWDEAEVARRYAEAWSGAELSSLRAGYWLEKFRAAGGAR